MIDELLDYLSRYLEIGDEVADALRKASLQRHFRKGTLLLREGDLAEEAYFIIRGCMRSYVLKDGEDRTIEFYLEESPVLPIGYGSGSPSPHYLECLEDTLAIASSPEQERVMLAKFPELRTVCMAMSEIMAEKLQDSLARYKTSTAEERYVQLAARRPDLLQRLPQYQIASYLGVQPETLSRIRGRLAAAGR